MFPLSCFHLLKVEPKFSSFSLKLKRKKMVNFFSTQTEIYKWFEQEADGRKKQEERALWNFFHILFSILQLASAADCLRVKQLSAGCWTSKEAS